MHGDGLLSGAFSFSYVLAYSMRDRETLHYAAKIGWRRNVLLNVKGNGTEKEMHVHPTEALVLLQLIVHPAQVAKWRQNVLQSSVNLSVRLSAGTRVCACLSVLSVIVACMNLSDVLLPYLLVMS